MLSYKELVPIGTTMLIGASCFGLGVVYAQLPYDLNVLWRNDGLGLAFERSLANFRQWAEAPRYVHHIFHVVMGLGMIGSFIKLYKPDGEAQYFEYGTLVLLMVAIIIYLTNLRTGVNSCVTGLWGDVDEKTGLSVMCASLVMIVVALTGVLVLQGGLYYAQLLDDKMRREFFAQEAAEQAAAQAAGATGESEPVESEAKATVTSTGAQKKKSGAKKRKET